MFADDTNVFYTGKRIGEVNNVVNNELKQTSQWFKVNKLSLNINTKITCVSITSLIWIDGLEVSREQVTKFLGVLVV